MKTRSALLVLGLLSTFNLQLSLFAQGTAFTYQGRLNDHGSPANGTYDLRFAIYDSSSAATNLIAGPLTNSATAISNGLFAATLDFGAGVFTGPARWLEIGVRTNGSGGFTNLSPRQLLTPAPYAISAANFIGALPSSQLAGSYHEAVVFDNGSDNFSGTFGGTFAGFGAGAFSGDGGSLTGLDASQLSHGTLPGARLAGSYTGSVTFNNPSNAFTGSFTGNGAGLTNLNIPAGTNLALLNGTNAFRGTNSFAGIMLATNSGNVLKGTFTGNGGAITNLSATNLTGTVPDARLTPNVALLNANQTFSGTNSFSAPLNLGPAPITVYAGSAGLLRADTAGNFAVGQSAGVAAGGSYNTAGGASALPNNTAGNYNTAFGAQALSNSVNGVENSAAGYQALLLNSSGSDNTAQGAYALFSNTNGINNTAVGVAALYGNTSGGNNIAIGVAAGQNLSTGSQNIDIGNPGVVGESNTIHIGTVGLQSNAFIAGIWENVSAGGVAVRVDSSGHLGIAAASSQKFKDNVRTMDEASDVLLALRPVTFRYKPAIDPQGIPQFGLVAEEVNEVDPDLVVRDHQGQIYGVRYDAINAMLLNEFLKQHEKLEEQNREIQELKQALRSLQDELLAHGPRVEAALPAAARERAGGGSAKPESK